jgi:hypothetical protein
LDLHIAYFDLVKTPPSASLEAFYGVIHPHAIIFFSLLIDVGLTSLDKIWTTVFFSLCHLSRVWALPRARVFAWPVLHGSLVFVACATIPRQETGFDR